MQTDKQKNKAKKQKNKKQTNKKEPNKQTIKDKQANRELEKRDQTTEIEG